MKAANHTASVVLQAPRPVTRHATPLPSAHSQRSTCTAYGHMAQGMQLPSHKHHGWPRSAPRAGPGIECLDSPPHAGPAPAGLCRHSGLAAGGWNWEGAGAPECRPCRTARRPPGWRAGGRMPSCLLGACPECGSLLRANAKLRGTRVQGSLNRAGFHIRLVRSWVRSWKLASPMGVGGCRWPTGSVLRAQFTHERWFVNIKSFQ